MEITHHPDIFSKKIKGKWIILEQNKDYIRELNEVAGMIWELSATPITAAKIAKIISSKFGYPLPEVKLDTEEFTAKYIKEGLLLEVK